MSDEFKTLDKLIDRHNAERKLLVYTQKRGWLIASKQGDEFWARGVGPHRIREWEILARAELPPPPESAR